MLSKFRAAFDGAYLGEQRGPDGLDTFDLSGTDQGLEFLGLFLDY